MAISDRFHVEMSDVFPTRHPWLARLRDGQAPKEPNKEPNEHEKDDPSRRRIRAPDKTPSPREPKPGKRGK